MYTRIKKVLGKKNYKTCNRHKGYYPWILNVGINEWEKLENVQKIKLGNSCYKNMAYYMWIHAQNLKK